jgi:hypothetical protein
VRLDGERGRHGHRFLAACRAVEPDATLPLQERESLVQAPNAAQLPEDCGAQRHGRQLHAGQRRAVLRERAERLAYVSSVRLALT